MRYLRKILLYIISILFASCAGFNSPTSQSTRLNNQPCEQKSARVDLFFEGEPIHFNYSRMAMVEAEGSENDPSEKILNQLKYEAWSNCGNAIINIKREFRRKKMFDEIYIYPVYSGIAVKVDMDEAYFSEHGASADTTFLLEHQSSLPSESTDDIKKKDKGNFQAGMAFAFVGLMIVLIGVSQ